MAYRVYFITVVCKRRERRFDDFHIASHACRVMADAATWSDARLMAWVLMPDHYHALIRLGEKTALPDVMRRANSVLAIATNKASGRSGQVWQSAYHERAMRNLAQTRAAVQYIIANPVQANLAQNAGDYPFWNAACLTCKELA